MDVSKQNAPTQLSVILQRLLSASIVTYSFMVLYATRHSLIFSDPYSIPENSLFDRGPDVVIAFASVCALWVLLIILKYHDQRKAR